MGVIKEVEPDSSWWCAVKGKQALFAAGGNPTSYKGKKEKKKKKCSQRGQSGVVGFPSLEMFKA